MAAVPVADPVVPAIEGIYEDDADMSLVVLWDAVASYDTQVKKTCKELDPRAPGPDINALDVSDLPEACSQRCSGPKADFVTVRNDRESDDIPMEAYFDIVNYTTGDDGPCC